MFLSISVLVMNLEETIHGLEPISESLSSTGLKEGLEELRGYSVWAEG